MLLIAVGCADIVRRLGGGLRVVPGLDAVDPGRLVMVVGVVLLQLATGNQLVRLLLGSVRFGGLALAQ